MSIKHLSAAEWPVLSALLDQVLALPEAERDGFVQSLDGERARHRDTLRALLSRPGAIETERFLDTLPPLDRAGANAGVDAGGALAAPAAGDAIGPYRLLSELGSGGMGAVWLAERVDGALKRRVALKLPRLSWARGLAERMARERDILAALEHPHIARLYDAGVDRHGRPYLALEYIEGQPINDCARTRQLSVKDRLPLLLQVCAAVAFAHSRLVVHRDLKPANILVTQDGQVRLLDFGIAKLMEGDVTQETQLTQLAGRALTLDYASPEQIRGEPIGTASDVYSLGVVAYELLTGARPYRLKRGSAAELEEAIASADPPRASDAAVDAHAKKALKGDLDAVLNKALKKSPAERYPTIDALAQDIRRHLDNEPVSAQPDAFAYRAGKFLLKYRVQAAAVGVVVLTLAAAALIALSQARQAALSEQDAQASRQRAEEQAALARQQTELARQQAAAALDARAAEQRAADEARTARDRAQALAQAGQREADARVAQAKLAQAEARRAVAVRDYLVELFEAGSYQQPDAVSLQNLTARALLDRGVASIDRLAAEEPDGHDYLLRIFSKLYQQMGLDERALQLQQRAVASMRVRYGSEDPRTAAASLAEAWTLWRLGRNDEARRLIAHARRVLERDSPDSPDLAQALYFEATLTSETQPQQAAALAQRSLRLLNKLGERGFRLAMAHNAHGLALRDLGQTEGALSAFSASRQEFDAMFGPGSVEAAHAAVESMRVLAAARRWREAAKAGEGAIEVLRRYARSNPALPVRPMLTMSRARLGIGDGPGSRAVLVEALALRRTVGDPGYRPTALDVERFLAMNDTVRGDCAAAFAGFSTLRAAMPPHLHEDQVQARVAELLCRVRLRQQPEAAALLAEVQAIASGQRLSRFRHEEIARASALVAAGRADAAATAGSIARYDKLAHPRDVALLRAQTALMLGDLAAVEAATAPWLARGPDAPDADMPVDGELALLAAQALRHSDVDRARALAARARAALQTVLVPHAPQLAALADLQEQLAPLQPLSAGRPTPASD